MIISENQEYKSREVSIDWEINMANLIAGQILNNEYCKENYARILTIAILKVEEALRTLR